VTYLQKSFNRLF